MYIPFLFKISFAPYKVYEADKLSSEQSFFFIKIGLISQEVSREAYLAPLEAPMHIISRKNKSNQRFLQVLYERSAAASSFASLVIFATYLRWTEEIHYYFTAHRTSKHPALCSCSC